MKRFLIASLSIVFSISSIAADPPSFHVPHRPVPHQPGSAITPLMRMKLDKSKAILEGLTLEDFDKMASNARSLRLLSTESGWNVIQSAEYANQSRDFRRAADLIVEAAQAKDIHRAAMGYMAMTVRCVECHSYMRKHRIERAHLPLERP